MSVPPLPPFYCFYPILPVGLGNVGDDVSANQNEEGISQSQTHTFTKISIGSQTDLEILLLYVQNLQQAFKPPPEDVLKPEMKPTEDKSQQLCLNEVEIDVEEEDVDNDDEDRETIVDDREDEDEDREEVISPSSLSVPQKVQFFEDFSKDKEYCSYAQAYSLNITSSMSRDVFMIT